MGEWGGEARGRGHASLRPGHGGCFRACVACVVVEVACVGVTCVCVACVGRRGEWKGVLRDTRSKGDGGKDVKGAAPDSFKLDLFLRRGRGCPGSLGNWAES